MTRLWFLGLGGAMLLWSCTMSNENVGKTTEALEAGFATDGGTIAAIEQEPSAVVAAADPVSGFSKIVVAFNDERSALLPGGSPMGWAWSFDDGVTWTKCNATAACNGTGVDTSRITNFKAFLRHPTLVSDGSATLVYATLADTDGNSATAERVVLVLSTDGGSTFDTAFPANDDGCSDGEQDMPHAVFDYSTAPPTLWVVWRHNGSGASFGGCIRRFFVDIPSHAIVPIDSPLDISGMDREGNGFGSQGGLMVQAGDGIVTVAYANSDEDDACPTGEHHGRAWATVSSVNNAHDFTDNSRIFHSDHWHSCLNQPSFARVQNSIRDFDFVRTPTGIEYAVIADTPKTVRFFMNPAGGVEGFRDITSNLNGWREWCPGTALSTATNGPTSNWKRFQDGPCATPFSSSGPPFHFHTMLPSIASDGNDRVTIGLFAFSATGKAQHPTLSVHSNANPLLPGSMFIAPSSIAGGSAAVPTSFSIAQKTVVQPFGAYFCMLPKVPTGQLVTPGCTADGTFFPFWVQASPLATPQIATHELQVQ